MTNEEQFESINKQLDLINILGNMKFSEIESAFETLSTIFLQQIALTANKEIESRGK